MSGIREMDMRGREMGCRGLEVGERRYQIARARKRLEAEQVDIELPRTQASSDCRDIESRGSG